MKIITGKPVAVLFSATDHERSEIGLINGLVICEPDVTVDPVDTVFCLKPFENRIEFYYFINDSLYKEVQIFAGCFIAGTVFCKPEPVIMPAKVSKELKCGTVNSVHINLRLI